MKDPRFERATVWIAATLAAATISALAWFLSDLSARIDKINDSIVNLRIEVASASELRTRVDLLEKELDRLRLKVDRP